MQIEADKALELLKNSPYHYEALIVKGEYFIETGKHSQVSINQVKSGVDHLKQAWNQVEELHKSDLSSAACVAQTKAEFRRAAKLLFLKQHGMDTVFNKDMKAEFKLIFSTLRKLQISQKVPKPHAETKTLNLAIVNLIDKEVITDLKQLHVPAHLLCSISLEFMIEPVTIESGRTYEKANIMAYFAERRAQALKAIDQADSDIEEERKIKESDYIICPITLKKVNPDIMIPSTSIRLMSEAYLNENSWAFEFNPREDYMKIQVWQ